MTKLVSIEDMADQLGLSPKTIRNKLSNGTWPLTPVRIGRLVRFRQTDIDLLVEGVI